MLWYSKKASLLVQARGMSPAPTFFLWTKHLTEATIPRREEVSWGRLG